MLRSLVSWWQSRFTPNLHQSTFLEKRLELVDKRHTELSQELQEIKNAIEPLTRMIEEMRAPPEGFQAQKRKAR